MGNPVPQYTCIRRTNVTVYSRRQNRSTVFSAVQLWVTIELALWKIVSKGLKAQLTLLAQKQQFRGRIASANNYARSGYCSYTIT